MTGFVNIHARVLISVKSHKELASLVTSENVEAFLKRLLGKEADVLAVIVSPPASNLVYTDDPPARIRSPARIDEV